MIARYKIRAAFYRDVAAILSKDDDLMPDGYTEEEQKAWCDARNELVTELERAAQVPSRLAAI